ncbi:membrane protein [Sporomusaceae bacterium FL31]|nr:membrane protein [Sporomusaceae bacterium FL31]GCE35313.1 membrane protein [Sporomusaceae bacterium]
MFGYFSGLMKVVLLFFYHLTSKLGFPNYGVAIILLTISLKTLLVPLAVKQISSMRRMRELGPQLKKLKEQHQGNILKQQEEVAKLYKEAGVNPLSAFLPMLIQMPLLTGIFYAIRSLTYVSHPSFLWIKNLAGSDPLYILPFLAAVTSYISAQQTITDSSQNKLLLMIMPCLIGFMALRFPAGLGLYWVVSNLFQIVQQWFLYRRPALRVPA